MVGTVYALLTYILGFVALEVSRAGTTPQTSDEFVRRMWAAFAMLCGASPVPASSGKTVRHRLNRGGNRQANTALYRIVVVRLRWHPPTRDYLARRTKQGLSKREIIRCLIGGLSRSRLEDRAVASR